MLIIASMVEKETLSPEERQLVAAVIYNRLHERMPLGIDATVRYGLHIPPTESILLVAAGRATTPYNTRKLPGLPPTPIANPGLASMQAAAHPAKVNYLYFVAQAGQEAPFLHGELRRVRALQGRARLPVIGGATKLVALLGQPVAESLSPRMQNAAFAARALDWAYVRARGRGLRSCGRPWPGSWPPATPGANVTIPHKQAVVELCDEAEGESVNTLLFRDGRVLGYNTDKAIVAGIESRSVCLIGAGGAAKALLPALPGEVHMFSRKGDWPPDASGAT